MPDLSFLLFRGKEKHIKGVQVSSCFASTLVVLCFVGSGPNPIEREEDRGSSSKSNSKALWMLAQKEASFQEMY